MPYTKIGPFVDDSAPYLSAATMNWIEDGIATANSGSSGASAGFGRYDLDSFAGATDDAKLTSALSFSAAQTNIPEITMPTTRQPQFNTGGRLLFSGMKIGGGPGGDRNPELSGGKLVSSFVKLRCGNGSSSWFIGPGGNVYDVHIHDIGFNGASTVQFIDVPVSGGSLFASRFENLGFDLFKHVFGRPAAPTGFTQVQTSGHWTMNNAWDTQVTVGGSDNALWDDGYLNIGTGQSSALVGDNLKFYILFSGLSNTKVGYIYASGLNGYNCLRVFGNSDGVHFFGGVYEGYKPTGLAGDGVHTLANPGNLVRLEGGAGAFFGGNFGQGMAQPDATHHGLIEVTGGEWNFYSPTFYKGSMSESVPALYQSGGRVAVYGATRRQAESWTARPGWKSVGGTFTMVGPATDMTAL